MKRIQEKIALFLIISVAFLLLITHSSYAVTPAERTEPPITPVSTEAYNDPGDPTPPLGGEWYYFFLGMQKIPGIEQIDPEDNPDFYKTTGIGFADVSIIKTSEGLVLIDAGDSIQSADKILDAMDKMQTFDNQQIKSIILTHMHTDHIRGASRFVDPSIRAASDLQIIASDEYEHSLYVQNDLLNEFQLRARAWQSGTIDSYNGWVRANGSYKYAFHLPWGASDKEDDEYDNSTTPMAPDVSISTETPPYASLYMGDKYFEFIKAPGETDDHLAVWMPNEGILFCGDLWYWAFPNLQSPTLSHRHIEDWIKSLRKLKKLNPKVLVTQHGDTVVGKVDVEGVLTKYIEAIQSVYDRTIKAINDGVPELEAANTIAKEIDFSKPIFTLDPADMLKESYLGDYYGTVYWTVRGIYKKYTGVADGNGTELFRLPPKYLARDIVSITGANNILRKAIDLQAANEHQRCIELCDILIAANPKEEQARKVKAYSCWVLAYHKLNINSYGSYRSAYALEKAAIAGEISK